jgi:hypothetical protein
MKALIDLSQECSQSVSVNKFRICFWRTDTLIKHVLIWTKEVTFNILSSWV